MSSHVEARSRLLAVLLALITLPAVVLGQAADRQKARSPTESVPKKREARNQKSNDASKPQQGGTLVDLVTDGATVIAVVRVDAMAQGEQGAAKNELNLKLESFDGAA